MKHGKLIVFEGLDGCGKSTQAAMLSERMKKRGLKVSLMHFPDYTTETGKRIARHLRGEKPAGATETAILYALDKYENAAKILKLLASGTTVILDRYTASNCAYQSARMKPAEREAFMKWILVLEMRLPRPDAEVFLDADPHIAFLKNVHKKGRAYLAGKRDIYEKDLAFQMQVRKQYLQLAKLTGMRIITASNRDTLFDRDQTHEKVLEELAKALRAKK